MNAALRRRLHLWPLTQNMQATPAAGGDIAAMAATLIQSRHTILPRRLAAPGPGADELAQILNVAAHAPGACIPFDGSGQPLRFG